MGLQRLQRGLRIGARVGILAGRLKEAGDPLRPALDLNPTASSLHASFGSSLAWQFALVHANRKDADAAFRWLERAFAQHDAGLVWFDGEPLLRSIATGPRYEAFRRKLKLVN